MIAVLPGTDGADGAGVVLAATQHLKASNPTGSRLTANDATGLSRPDLPTGARLRVALQANPGK